MNMKLFNPHSNEWLSNKFKIYDSLRAMDVAYYSEQHNGHIITRYDDVKFILKNDTIFSSAKGNLIRESSKRLGKTLGASDDPVHGMLKNIIKEAYSKKNIERISSCFAKKSVEILSQYKPKFNLLDVSRDVSAWSSVEILNLPYDREEIQKLLVGILRYAEQSVESNIDQSYYTNFVDIVKKMLNDRVEPIGPGIYNEFFINDPTSPYMSLFTGPTISGASSLAGALVFLTIDLYRENLFHTLKNDMSLITNVVNESLRYNSSSGRKVRTVTEYITIHNVNFKPGDRVILSLEAANRDSSMFTDPDKFIINRDNAGSLAFGYGMHACIASAISKELLKVWVESLLKVMGKYKITTSPLDYEFLMTSSGNQDNIINIILENIN